MPNTIKGVEIDPVKEKLVELLIAADDYENSVCLGYPCKVCQYKGTDCTYKAQADHLIAHGVTVQGDKDINVTTKWISVKDRLPEKDGHYLCNYHFGEYPKMTFTQVLDYYATDIVPHFQHTLGDGSMKVTHWMEIPKLPQPPKGE